MSADKSEAQLRNEEEVRRLLKERGYSSFDYKKTPPKTKKKISLKPLITVLAIIALGTGGYALYQYLASTPPLVDDSRKQTAQTVPNKYQSDFQACLDAIDMTAISVDDANYWDKNISRYKQFIACYDKYPAIASQTEKADLEKRLADYQKYASQSKTNEAEARRSLAESEKKYQETIAKNQAEYQKKKAELDAEAKAKTEEYAKQRSEREAQYEQERQEREQKTAAAEAQKQAEEAAKKQACDNYKATYGDKTPQEIAESDSEVVRAKYNWTNAQSKVRNNCNYGTQANRDLCNSYRNQELQTAESYHTTYTNLLQQKISYYRDLKVKSCN